ncbi:MAG: xanthine dehydrogenase family protein subunit M [Aigarchaeota archaeon]|nr:xanthine dehydrogenase family protein subunit M [Aigarchaeota archaeon]MDW7986773.1 xanthine dehydrogenase family protein subunit M [Nitrososphaerota archaeon]
MRADYVNIVNTHIVPVKLTYHAPKSIEESLRLLANYRKKARILAGGTDLVVDMKLRRKEPEHIISLKKIKELDYIVDDGSAVRVGAATKLRTIEKNKIIRERFQALYEAVRSIGSIQVRNMGTLVGNICNASPAADTAPPLLIFNATVIAKSLNGERTIPINKFFKGPGITSLEDNEMVTEVSIPYPPENSGSSFLKISRVGMDLAKVNVAVLVKLDKGVVEECRIALGAVAPTPLRISKAEEYLRYKSINEENLRVVQEIVAEEIKPITDVRSTEWYRREVSKILVRDAIKLSVERVKK